MEFRNRRRSDIRLDMTPMIDCVFQLLIFFLLSSTFLNPAVQLKLPRASVDKSVKSEAVVVTLDSNGQLFVNRNEASLDSLPEQLLDLQPVNEKPAVLLRADRSLAYERILEVLICIQKAGIAQVQLAYEDQTASR